MSIVGRPYTISAHAHGTLAADFKGRFKLKRQAVLDYIEFSCSSATAATLDFGPAADPDGICDDKAVGQSDAVNHIDRDDFNGALYTDAADIENVILAADTVYHWVVTHASAQNLDIIFHLIE